MKIALAQLTSTPDVPTNLRKVTDMVQQAASQNAQLVIFPEATMAAFGSDLPTLATAHAADWRVALTQLATQHKLAIVTGEFETATGRKVRNLLGIYHPDGTREEYTKIHLYDAFGFTESKGVEPGTQPVVTTVAGTTVGVAICYDIRFPKLFAELSRKGAQVIAVPASWGAGPGKVEQWTVLARARALDSNSFVVAVDQADPTATSVETDGKSPTGVGHSLASDPFGHVVTALGAGEELAVVDLDLALVKQAKTSIPVLDNARLGY